MYRGIKHEIGDCLMDLFSLAIAYHDDIIKNKLSIEDYVKKYEYDEKSIIKCENNIKTGKLVYNLIKPYYRKIEKLYYEIL